MALLEALPRVNDNPYVIVGKKENTHLTDLQHPWRRIRKAAGLDDVRIHDLRHTFASGGLLVGEGLAMIGKLLGHTQVQTTARYAHLASDPVKQAATKISDRLASALLGAINEAGAGEAAIIRLAKRRTAKQRPPDRRVARGSRKAVNNKGHEASGGLGKASENKCGSRR